MNKGKAMLVRVPLELHRELKIIAVERGVTMASIARMAFEEVLGRLRRERMWGKRVFVTGEVRAEGEEAFKVGE